jgi:hypothetical protein
LREYYDDDLHFFGFESFPNGTGAGGPGGTRLRHAVFSRKGGHSEGPFASLNLSLSVPDEKARVYANRRKVYGRFGRDTDTVVHAHLVHGADVARVSRADDGTWVHHVDGIVTDQPGCVLTMNYADCAPILLVDPARGAIGLGHAGWRGAMVDLPGALVRAMSDHFGSDPADLLAAVGPCIGPCCYEVGPDVVEAAAAAFDDAGTLFSDNGPLTDDRDRQERGPAAGGRLHFDLPEANRRALVRAGLRSVELSGLCTACRTDLFFSHRAEKGRTGRFGAVLMIEP